MEPRWQGPGARSLAQPARGGCLHLRRGAAPRLRSTSRHGTPPSTAWSGGCRGGWSGRAQNRVDLECELRPSPAYPFALRLDRRVPAGPGRADRDHRRREHRPVRPPVRSRLPPLPHGGHPDASTRCGCGFPLARRLLTDDRGLPPGETGVAGTEFDFTTGTADRRDPARHRLQRPGPRRRRPGPGRARPPRRRLGG